MGLAKWKVYCQRRFSKENVILKLSKYTTRIFVGLVWCAVLWAFLSNDSLPRQYVEYLLSKNPRPCIESTASIPAEDREQLISLLPFSWNNSLIDTDYQLLALSRENDTTNSTLYQVLLVRQNAVCFNVLELKGFRVVVPHSNVTVEEVATELVSTDSVDVLSVLNPETSSSLLKIPVGHFFALTLLFVMSSVFGVLAKWLLLPQLMGMLLAGFLLRNVPGIDFARHISSIWSSNIRNIALIIILMRGGISMDFKQLKRLKFAVLLLAIVPCVLEGALDGLIATFWIKLPWQFAFTLGYLVAAISPSVTIPAILSIQSQGYGRASGVPTLLVGAASLDVVVTISLFGIFLGLAFSDGSLVLDIFRAPIQIVVGISYGIIFGLLLWVFPTKHFTEASKVRNRVFLTLGLGLFSLFGSTRAVIGGSNLAGSGALGALVLAFVAAQGWDTTEKKLVQRVFFIIWQFFEPFLFGLIGAAVDLRFISSSLVGQGVGLILCGLVLRLVCSSIVIMGNGFGWLEVCFISIAWIPKATVQAAIGSLALDTALLIYNNDESALPVVYGRQILTVAVLAMLLTAPLGAAAISLLGPVLLKKSDSPSDSEEAAVPERKSIEGIPTMSQEIELNGRVGVYEVQVENSNLPSMPVNHITEQNSHVHSSAQSLEDQPSKEPSVQDMTSLVNSPKTTAHEVIELSGDIVIREFDSEPRRYQ